MTMAFVLTGGGSVGGAQKRFFNLFKYLQKAGDSSCCFLTSRYYYKKIREMDQNYPLERVYVVDEYDLPSGRQAMKQPDVGHKTPNNTFFSGVKKIIPSYGLKMYRYFKSRIYQYRIYKRIHALVCREKIDVLVGIYAGVLPLYFYFRKKKRPAIVFVDMDSWFTEVLSSEEYRWDQKYSSFNEALKRADVVDFLSPYIREGISKKGIDVPHERASITPCSFSLYEKFTVKEKKPFSFVFAARLEPMKNPLMYFNSSLLLARQYPEVRFYLLGDGPLLETIRKKAGEGNLHNLIIPGFVPDPEKYFAFTSVFVSVQETNNYPSQSVLEAMACGNMIIASDVGDTRMFVNEENGILIPLSMEHLKNAMEWCITHPSEVHKKGRHAASYVRTFHTAERVAAYYKEIAEKACRNKDNNR